MVAVGVVKGLICDLELEMLEGGCLIDTQSYSLMMDGQNEPSTLHEKL